MAVDRKNLRRLMNAVNAMDGAYALKTKQLDEKPNVMLLMYALSTQEMSQKQISDTWLTPLSTINTVARELVQRGLIVLEPIKGRHRERLMRLTPAGRRFAKRLLKPFQHAERAAMEKTAEEFGKQFVDAMEKYVEVFRRELGIDVQ